MRRIILLRHGQTEWNRIERFRGQADLGLDDTGVRQAEAAAVRLSGLGVEALYSSPLRRALMTAEIVGHRLGLPVQTLSGLIDIDYGNWQGLSPEEASALDNNLYTRWLNCPHQVKFPQGESLQQVRERALAAADSVLTMPKEQTAVLVSHKVVCQVLLCALLGLDNSHFWQVGQSLCAINVFEVWDGSPLVTLVNDTCHLKNLGQP